jgi:hypothetical protein
MLDGGAVAVSEGDEVTSNRAVRQMGDLIREFEHQLGRKPLKVEILKEALEKSRSKTYVARAVAAEGRFPMSVVTETMDVPSDLHARVRRIGTPRRMIIKHKMRR